MPKIQGQDFPPYQYREFPKTLYAGGDLQGESRIVHGASDQEEAEAEGFVAVASEPPAEVVEDADLDFPEPPAGSAIDSDPHHVLVHDGASTDEPVENGVDGDEPSPDAFNGADPAEFDHDGDGKPGGSKARKAK